MLIDFKSMFSKVHPDRFVRCFNEVKVITGEIKTRPLADFNNVFRLLESEGYVCNHLWMNNYTLSCLESNKDFSGHYIGGCLWTALVSLDDRLDDFAFTAQGQKS